MGWYGTYSGINDIKKEMLTDKVVAHASTNYGRNLWVVYNHPEGYQFISLFLIRKLSDGYYYKPVDESMGPNEVDCPLKFLDIPLKDVGYAKQWRENVVAYHAKRKQKFELGDAIKLYGKTYKIVKKVRRSYVIECMETLKRYVSSASKMEMVPCQN